MKFDQVEKTVCCLISQKTFEESAITTFVFSQTREYAEGDDYGHYDYNDGSHDEDDD